MVRGCPDAIFNSKGKPRMKKHNHHSSLLDFSWKNNNEKSTCQNLIEDTVKEWYAAKHRKAVDNEIILINERKIAECIYCESSNFVKDGFTKNGLQRYRCNNCGKRFNILSNSLFFAKKIPLSEHIEYLIHLFQYHSIKSSAFDNRNVYSTGIYWLRKVFLVLEGIQDNIILKNKVYIDECFVPVENKNIRTKNGKKLRGISMNQICIVTGKDDNNTFYFATKSSKLSSSSALKYYGNHIEKGSTIIHDKEKSHNILIEKLELNSIKFDSKEIKKEKNNPLQSINKEHAYLKKFLKAHNGYKKTDLQNWLNLFWFISNIKGNKYDLVDTFIERALKIQKKLKYRDQFSKKS